MPKWETEGRKARLLKVAVDSIHDLASWRVDLLTGAFFSPKYNLEAIISDWKAEDREAARLEWKRVQREIHSLGETRTPIRGRFSNIARDIWADKQPLFYLEAMGMDALKLRPFARVKVASSYFRLYVDLGDSLRPVSKNRKRKAIRYGKPLPPSVDQAIAQKIGRAVQDYLK